MLNLQWPIEQLMQETQKSQKLHRIHRKHLNFFLEFFLWFLCNFCAFCVPLLHHYWRPHRDITALQEPIHAAP